RVDANILEAPSSFFDHDSSRNLAETRTWKGHALRQKRIARNRKLGFAVSDDGILNRNLKCAFGTGQKVLGQEEFKLGRRRSLHRQSSELLRDQSDTVQHQLAGFDAQPLFARAKRHLASRLSLQEVALPAVSRAIEEGPEQTQMNRRVVDEKA